VRRSELPAVARAVRRLGDPRAARRPWATDREAEVDRLLALGARRVDWRYPEGADYIVLADPDGNKFCVVQK
jgi:Glyoxalase-like domain